TPAPVKQLLEHPRFRAAYDLLALRALAGDASMELAQWWTNIQEADEPERERLIAAQSQEDGAAIKRRKRHRKKPSDPGSHE
ncbi:MAG TPA: hypothetical protein PLV25_04895, partial [Opitutales bacterium]|nr:hypothetical protein [Opitutales bacterium]